MLLDKNFFYPEKDHTIILVAPGPSLNIEQIKQIEQSEHFTITIGDAGRVALPYADILYHCDKKWWDYYDGCPEFHNTKVSLEETLHTYQAPRSQVRQGLDLTFPYLVTGNNSGYQAINLAVHFEPKTIILVGFDMQDSRGRHNIIGDHPKEIKRPSNFELFRDNIGTLVKPLEELGIKVYNCTADTALNCFPKRKLTDVI